MAEIEKMTMIEKLIVNLQKPKPINKVTFFRLLSITQRAGLGIRDALQSLRRSETNPGMRRILDDLLDQINKGFNLADSLRNHNYFFSNQEIELIKSSETMGNTPEVLTNIAIELERFQSLVSKIKGSLTYPVFVLLLAIVACVYLILQVIPTIVDLFPSKDNLPGITVFMLGTKDFILAYWYIVIGVLIAIPVTFKILYKYVLGFKILIDDLVLRSSLLGELVRKFNLYRFSKLLGDYYNAGVSPTVALGQIGDVLANYHYKKKLFEIKGDLEIGLNFTESMEGSRLFDPILVQIIGIGEDTGNIGEVLEKMANFYREELDNTIEGLMKLIEPSLMIVVAGVIGTIVASIFLPLGDLIGTFG